MVRPTAARDREQLNLSVATLAAEWLRPLELHLLVMVAGGDLGARLQCIASLVDGDMRFVSTEATLPLGEMSALPVHEISLKTGLLESGGADGAGRWAYVLPLAHGHDLPVLIEIQVAHPLASDQLELLQRLGVVHRHQAELLDYGERDGLTGLRNRRTFEMQFGKSLALSAHMPTDRRHSGSQRYWCGVIDIDHFKRVNDECGHLIGDEVLLLVGQLLRSAFRHEDHLYRFGGEEFVVLLQAKDQGGAQAAFERFRQTMAEHRFPQVGHVTASIGYTGLRQPDTASACFDRADEAVYDAKRAGRNRVLCHELLVESGALVEAGKVGAIELF